MTPIVSPPFATHDDIREAIYGYGRPSKVDFIGFKEL